MDSELIIKLLSMGVVASFVTGIFSLVISIKNNKRLLQIEDKKERFQMDKRRYELLNELLKNIECLKFGFEKEGEVPEQSWKYLRKTFSKSIDIFESIKKLHKEKSYLLNVTLDLDITIENIDKKYLIIYKHLKRIMMLIKMC